MRILFITTHNLATNPRLYKEIVLAKEAGHEATVISFSFDNWSRLHNDRLLETLDGVRFITIPAGREPALPWAISVVAEQVARLAGRLFPLPLAMLAQAVSRRSGLLVKALKGATAPDLVIGHNPGALYATKVAGERFGCKTGFDIEDYHPGEGHNRPLQKLTRNLLKKTLPSFTYVSYASPLIRQAIEADLHAAVPLGFTVMNFFPSADFREPQESSGPLKMVWFSQNISYGRGLEIMLPQLKNYTGKIELHLYGNLDNRFYEAVLKDVPAVHMHPPLPQKELHQALANYDVGLALDVPVDKNREFAVSNKLLAYLQAGLYVLATNTAAQKAVLDEFSEHGFYFDYQGADAAPALEKISGDLEAIRNESKGRYHRFSDNNWERASQQVRDAWESRN